MKRAGSRLLMVFLAAGAAVAYHGAPIPDSPGLATVIRELPGAAVDLQELVGVVGRQCDFSVVVDPKVAGTCSMETVPATARSMLDAALPGRGFLYLVEDRTLRVMAEEDLRGYFRERAIFRTYGVWITPGVIERLLDAPDLVSTMGFLGIDPERGVVWVYDLPGYAGRIEQILSAGEEGEVLITL